MILQYKNRVKKFYNEDLRAILSVYDGENLSFKTGMLHLKTDTTSAFLVSVSVIINI